MQSVPLDRVHTFIVSSVSEFKARCARAARPRKLSMRDLVASQAPKAPSIRDVFAPALAA